MLPYVSVIIPTYNRAHLLGDCLTSLESLAYPIERFEVIVIDDGSTDSTPEVLAKFCSRTKLNFRPLSQRNRGPAAARNLGLWRAAGSFLAFTDDDCTVDADWIAALMEGFAETTIAGVGGLIRSRSTGLISDYMSLNNCLASSLGGEEVPPFLITANACYRTEILRQIGGFDERIAHPGGEDPDVSFRVVALGHSLAISPRAIIYHHHRTRLIEFARSFYHYGQGDCYLARKHGLTGVDGRAIARLLSARGFAYRVKQYATAAGVGWQKGMTYAFLDQVRDLARLAGYWSMNGRLGNWERSHPVRE
jgi:glycosyltransferase involved in cell wall biosynthesis